MDKWITPKKDICENSGGKMDKNEYCLADWREAQKICTQSGGRLETSKNLIDKVIIDCGGIAVFLNDLLLDNTYQSMNAPRQTYLDKNKKNENYQFFYRKKGFRGDNFYWTSDENIHFGGISINFNSGSIIAGSGIDPHAYYVRCVK